MEEVGNANCYDLWFVGDLTFCAVGVWCEASSFMHVAQTVSYKAKESFHCIILTKMMKKRISTVLLAVVVGGAVATVASALSREGSHPQHLHPEAVC